MAKNIPRNRKSLQSFIVRVAVIIDTWFPAIGGGQINTWEISKRIAAKGIEIDIITRNNGAYKRNRIKNLKIYKLGSKAQPTDNISRLLFLVNAFFFIKKRNYDIVHLQAFLPGLLSPPIKHFLKTPTILTVHGTRMFEKNTNLSFGFLLEKFILTKIKYDTQISVTKAFMKFNNINKQSFSTNKNIVYIPNGIDLQKFKNIKVRKAKYPKILWVGRFDPIKRVEDLISAMKTINIKIPEAKLTLVGYGQEEQKMKDLTKKLKVKNVQFVGKKEGIELIKEYKSSHVFVLPSSSEGQPLSILEALVCNLPIVATNVGGIPEMVNKSNGILIQPNSINFLADAILDILQNKKHFKQSVSLEDFSWHFAGTKTNQLYNSIYEK